MIRCRWVNEQTATDTREYRPLVALLAIEKRRLKSPVLRICQRLELVYPRLGATLSIS